MSRARSLLEIPLVLLRTYGWRGIARRVMHELRRSLGAFRRHPSSSERPDTPQATALYGPSGNWRSLPAQDLERIVLRADRVVAGSFQAYGSEWRPFPAAQGWRQHPAAGFEFPMVEWWKVPLMPAEADIKDVWEPARFGWVYDLVRAYAATGNASYPRAFHERFKEWQAANPAFMGPHWACGQEVAIRALAILHALDGFPSNAADDAALQRMIAVLGWSGERIADAIGYGLSQRNNHGISEAAGLIHIGMRLREVHSDADSWLRLGQRLLEEQIRDQFAADGWYAQHSFNYTRVALDQALHARRALRAAGRDLRPGSLQLLDAAVRLLTHLTDENTGEVPNHGANDGARVVPLSSTAYRDFRPLLTLAAVVNGTALPRDIPADAETLRWLGVDAPAPAPLRGDGVFTGESGWAIARIGRCVAFLRAGAYRHRPSHLDALHLDLRIAGKEIITDPGTFAYNAAAPWNNGLASGLVHNGPVLEGEALAKRGPRFLWLSWPAARLVFAGRECGQVKLVAERAGRISREVLIGPDAARVDDRDLQSDGSTPLQVTWLLHPDVADLDLVRAQGSSQLRAEEGDVTAWYSPTYAVREPSRAVRIVRAGAIATTISLRPEPSAAQ